jgi:hypothetical protein
VNPDGGDRGEDSEVHELCDGCRQSHPASELCLIGDGSINVCRMCREKAIAVVRE